MKRILFVLFMVFAAGYANAQVWIGGGISASSESEKLGGTEISKSKTFSFNPCIGYTFSDRWEAGIEFGIRHAGEESASVNTYEVSPFVRYNWAHIGDFRVYTDQYVELGYNHTHGDSSNENYYGAGILPGLAYDINDHLSLDLEMGGLEWSHSKYGETTATSLGFELTTHVEIGLYYCF